MLINVNTAIYQLNYLLTLPEKKSVEEWAALSSANGILRGHIGPLDGWFVITDMPFDVPHQIDYRSGHYQRYGLNVQAICDAYLRFIYFTVVGPVNMNDAKAFRRLLGLQKWLESLEPRF